ncbi:MAG: acetate--CoA ligase [Candidatus Melainabacteria bacterium]|nr:acetate--CoA ligase [Candidatus Melainabacteria bacterium]
MSQAASSSTTGVVFSRQGNTRFSGYEDFCRQVTWQDTAQQLQLPRSNGVNKATLCIDEHPPEVMQRHALRWLATDGSREDYTFEDLKQLTNRFANVLTQLGVRPGDRVFVYLERIPELYVCLFGALKVQAVVGPLFSAFGPEAIQDRLADAGAVLVVTSPTLKPRLDAIADQLPALQHVVVVDRYQTWQPTHTENKRIQEHAYETLMNQASDVFTVPPTDPDTYSIMHYTSGTTGKPKGAVHRHLAVVAQAATTQHVLDIRPEQDVYWCTADPGWVTGTSYGMFGPWALGTTLVVYEGPFDADRWYQVIQDYQVTVWYTAPTAIRMLMKAGDARVKNYNLGSLRHLASVGEPLNPEAIHWGHQLFGKVFHDTWWQTETGAIHIANYPCLEVKPGSMGKPFPGVVAAVLDDTWNPLPAGEEGCLALRPEAPSIFRTYWQRDDLYQSRLKNGWYITGDRARVDEDGYFWFIGREDDVINTAGHLVGPFEVESALIEHPAVAEAGVIGKPDPERLEIIKAFVSLKVGYEPSEALKKEIQTFVRQRLAAHAYPREVEFIASLPKTRSGKIMRRLLKARELGLPEGDTSTLEE